MTTGLEFNEARWRHDDLFVDLEPPLKQLIRLIRRRGRLIFILAVIGAVLGGVVGLLIPPRYTATAELVAEPQLPALAPGQAPPLMPPEDESTIQSYVVALTSRGHLERVIASLSHDPPLQTASERPQRDPHFLDTVIAWLVETWTTANRALLDILSPLRSPDAAKVAGHMGRDVEAFRQHLHVFQEQGSHVLGVSFTASNPEEAERAANRVAKLYAAAIYDQKRETTQRTLAWINRRIPEMKSEVDRFDSAAQAYQTKRGLAQAGQTDTVDQRLADLNRRVTDAQAELSERQSQRDAVRRVLQHGETGVDTVVQTIDSTTLQALRNREAALQQIEAQLSATLGVMHPRSQEVLAQLGAVRSSIAIAVHRAASDLDAQVKASTLQLQTLRAQLASVQANSADTRGAGARLQDMERGAATIRQVYESLLQQREALIEQQEMISPDVRILSLATPPDRPSSVNPLLFPLPAMVTFLIGGILMAAITDRLDQGLRSARDIRETLGIPCIGLVPKVRRARPRLHQHLLSKPFAPYAEAIRSLAAGLKLPMRYAMPQVVLISSSVPREGKTTLAVSLATYAALIGRRVVLVDLDFRRPAIWRAIAGKGNRTASDCADRDHLSLAAIETIPQLGLDVLPVRRRPEDPLLPFAGGELPDLFRQLRSSYDFIVIDGPPLLAVTEARLLASFVDKVLFVVKWGSTRKDMAQNALDLLRDAHVFERQRDEMIVGVVTQVDVNKHARYRYGDTGESFVRYARYYIKNQKALPPRSRRSSLPPGGDGQIKPAP